MEQARGIIVKTLTILAGFWIADLAAARVQAGLAAGESIERIMDGMTTMLQHPLALGFDRTSLLCGLGGACAVGLFHLYRWSMKRNWRDGEEYGSARWSTSREMAPYTDNDTRQNLQMTATEGLSLDAPATRRNLNTAVIGGSGSGKTATHVIPNILKGSMNYACTDPKGELYAKTGGDLEKMGYTVKQLDLVDLTSETKFNPMRYIDPTKPDVAIMRLVTNIMDNTNGSTPKEHQTDDFWTKSERSLLTALTAFVYYLPDEDPTFNFLAAIFYQCLFDSIIRRCRTYPGECLATPLHCFLDEFANVGRIPNFDKLIATIRSRKVSVSIILQTIAQLKTMYKDSWETIVGNCDSVLFLGGNEQSTTEWLSKLLGKETIDICTTSDSKGVSGSHTTNYQRTGRELLTPDELAQLDNDKCIYNLRGLHPFLSRKAWPGTTIARPKSTLRHSKEWKAAA